MVKVTSYYLMIVLLLVSCLFVVEHVYAQSSANNSNDIDGIYISDMRDIYQIKQINNTVWILGTEDSGYGQGTIVNIFSGTLDKSNNRITGEWISNPLFNNTVGGNISFDLLIGDSKENITINTISSTTESNNIYPLNMLTKYNPAIHDPLKVYVSIENILINIPRSPTSDKLYIGLSGQKNDDNPLTATKYLGFRADGSNITADLRIGPFLLDNKNDTLKVYILGVDKEDGTTPFTLTSIRDTLIQLMEQSYNVTDLVQGINIIRSLTPALIPTGCNGIVFMDKFEFLSESLRNLTISSNGKDIQEKTYTGTTSPPGCGPPSQYVVKLSITAFI